MPASRSRSRASPGLRSGAGWSSMRRGSWSQVRASIAGRKSSPRITSESSALHSYFGARKPVVPRIEFVASAVGAKKTVDVPEGGALVDVCDEYLAPVPFSCRSASCATCHIEVLEGAELLEPPEAEERVL